MLFYPVDLHAHTTASDGVYPPAQLVERAATRDLRVLGVADHDTIDGLAEAIAAGRRLGIEVVPGIEFSLRHEPDKQFIAIHLLGYFIDPAAPALMAVMDKVRQGRVEQKIKQIEKLQAFGFDVPVDEVFARAKGVPGRPHIVAVLMERNPGQFESVQQIFDEYLGTGAKAYVGRQFALTLGQAAAIIKQAGGLPVLAHPGAYGVNVDPLAIVRQAAAEGVEGVEVFYPYAAGHRPANGAADWPTCLAALAGELGLLQTGGTDFHGRPHDVVDLGEMGLTEAQFSLLKQGWQKLRGSAG